MSFKRFALAQARGGGGDIDHVRAEPKRRQLEGRAGARAWFDKEIHQRFPAQSRDFFDLARADLLEGIRSLENKIDFVG